MVLKHAVCVKIVISHFVKPKTHSSSYICNFLSNRNNLGLYFTVEIHGNRQFLSPTILHDIIVTSYMESLYFVWYVWKEETHIYITVPHNHTLVIYFWISQASGNHLPPPVLQKRLVRMRFEPLGPPSPFGLKKNYTTLKIYIHPGDDPHICSKLRIGFFLPSWIYLTSKSGVQLLYYYIIVHVCLQLLLFMSLFKVIRPSKCGQMVEMGQVYFICT